MSGVDFIYVFFTQYGLVTLNDRFEFLSFDGREEHKEAALQEWFTHLRERLKTHEPPKCPECGYIVRVCLGCGRTDC